MLFNSYCLGFVIFGILLEVLSWFGKNNLFDCVSSNERFLEFCKIFFVVIVFFGIILFVVFE